MKNSSHKSEEQPTTQQTTNEREYQLVWLDEFNGNK